MAKRKLKNYDVIVIGAGVAGLSCAAHLLEHGKKVLVLEARNRVGGRAYTVHPQDGLPLDLGPEFIHGAPGTLLHILKEQNRTFYDVTDRRFFFDRKGRIHEAPDFWDNLKIQIKRLPKGNQKDQSVEDFSKTIRQSYEKKEMFRSFVEGFHAADLQLMSSHGLRDAEEVSKEADLNEIELFRPLDGYGAIFRQFVEDKPLLKKSLVLKTPVTRMDWSQKGVRIFSDQKSWQSDYVVVTVPLGVLKSDQLEWQPHRPKALEENLKSVEMGHIQKITFKFKSRLWESRFKKAPGFFHTTSDHYFPTWWSLEPLRTPHLVAWQGGPKAQEMGTWSEEKRIQAALATLSKLLQVSVKSLNNQVHDYQTHNWSKDPYSLGAYSFIKVNGLKGSQKLNQLFEGRFLIAGEATCKGSERGTIHGAQHSGVTAAKKILKRTRG